MATVRYFFLSFLLLTACAQRPKTGEVIAEARALQAEALQTGQEAQTQLQELEQRRNSIQIQGRALSDEEITFVNQVNHLLARFADWEEDRPAIPEKVTGDPNDLLQEHRAYLETIQAIRGEAAVLLR